MKKQREDRRPRIKLDPKLIRITSDEIQADLTYPASARRRERRA
jgi:hypothetical protein